MDKGPHTDLHLNSWIWLSRTRDAVFSARRKELHRYAISARQASVMFVIQALGDKATPGEISRWLLREPNSVSEFLKRMEKDGLIKRSPDPRRRNVVRVKLTEKGIKAHQKTTKLESIHKVMAVLSEEEIGQLIKLLEKLWYRALRKLEIDRHPPFPPSE
jgi:DNA-binding MarR family transcriptional regulator